MIILDFGSGNTCRNDWSIAKEMIDTVNMIDLDKKFKIKWQLFEKIGENIPLDWRIFKKSKDYENGREISASVFDTESLDFLLQFNPIWIKFANNSESRKLIKLFSSYVYSKPEKEFHGLFMVSIESKFIFEGIRLGNLQKNIRPLCCISKYPASIEDYEQNFNYEQLRYGISDHTTDWTLYKKYQPENYECHFCLDDSTGLDAGPFARRPGQLKEIL